MRTYHWFDFVVSLPWKDGSKSVKVEATISSGSGSGVAIEGIKVRLLDSDVEIVPTDAQLQYIHEEVFKRI